MASNCRYAEQVQHCKYGERLNVFIRKCCTTHENEPHSRHPSYSGRNRNNKPGTVNISLRKMVASVNFVLHFAAGLGSLQSALSSKTSFTKRVIGSCCAQVELPSV